MKAFEGFGEHGSSFRRAKPENLRGIFSRRENPAYF